VSQTIGRPNLRSASRFSGRSTAPPPVASTPEKRLRRSASTAASWHRGQSDEAQLKKLVEDHHKWTGSLRAREILDQWATARAKFVKVFPHEYKRALSQTAAKAQAAAAAPAATVAA
jgi:glutamate synthase domain-containing protein 3